MTVTTVEIGIYCHLGQEPRSVKINPVGACSILLACTITILLMARLVFNESTVSRVFTIRVAVSVLISAPMLDRGSLCRT